MANIVARLRTEDVRAVGAQHPPLARADSIGIGSDSVVAVPGLAGGDHRGLRPDPDAMAQRSGVWSALRRNADSGTPGPALGRGVPGQLRRSVSSTSGAGGPGVIRRFHDPAVNPGNLVPAQDYVRDNSTAMIDGLVQMIQSVGGQKTAAEAITIALTSAQPANANEAAEANLMLTQAHGGIAINPVPAVGAVALAVRALNYAEREVTTRGALKQDIRKVKIGTEFSFGDGRAASDEEASINIRVGMPAAPENESQKAKLAREAAYNRPRTRATQHILEWANAAVTGAKAIPGTPTVGVSNHRGKADFAKKITYTFTQPKEWTWYWVADIDEGCYETQTMPTAIGDFAEPAIRAIITEHIFNGAAQVKLVEATGSGKKKKDEAEQPVQQGLRPDPTSSGGGGHLSFDVGTAFGDANGVVSLELLATTLRELQGNADDLAREFRKDTKGRPLRQRNANNTGDEPVPLDSANAPSLATQGVRDHPTHDAMKKYTTLVGRINTAALRGDAVRLSGIHRGLVAFNQTLTNPEVTDVDRKAHVEDPANISHYQAINTEHLADEGGGARIEVRDVPAQTDYAKFLQDLDVLTKALNGARKIVSDAQMVRVT